MKSSGSTGLSILAAGALALTLCGVALAQATKSPASGTPRYDARTETTVSGTVKEVLQVPAPGKSTGIHLVLQENSGTVEVHVGPSWYLKQQKYEVAKGDHIQVTGSKVRFQNADVILAREIKKGDNAWTLRDAQGFPMWAGKKRGS